MTVSCSKALEKIDNQSKHWHSMVSAIDFSYSLGSRKNMAGKSTYDIYSYLSSFTTLLKNLIYKISVKK